MKILITGGAGFIGTNLIKQLIKEGHETYSIDNYDSGLKENHVNGCEYRKMDIEELIDIDDNEFDVVYHLAGLSRIQPSFENPTETFRVNTKGTQVVCEWARLNNVKMIYAGSSSRWHDPYQSPYACFKHMGEEVIRMYKKTYGLNAEIARFYNVYGPNEIIDGDWAAVIGIWRKQIRDKQPLTIIGDGEQRRDFTHVDDIVSGLILIMNVEHDDAWELGTGTNYSINEVYQMFKENFDIECIHLPQQKGNYRKTLRENDTALEKLGWKPSDRLKNYISSLK